MKENIKTIIINAIKKAGYSIPQNFSIETPPKAELGDYATNVAMIIAGRDKKIQKKLLKKL
jgi:arginyl-tRNA synthetase